MTSTTSLRYNTDDIAAVVHKALWVVAKSEPVVDNLLPLVETHGPAPSLPPLGQAATLALTEYANACGFLSSCVLDNHGCLCPGTLSCARDGCDAKAGANSRAVEFQSALRRYSMTARRFGGEAELPMHLLGDLPALAHRLYVKIPQVERLLQAVLQTNGPSGSRWAATAFKYPKLVWDSSAANIMCPRCKEEVKEKNEGGEIACDKCSQWFHLRCLELPETFPQSVGEWYCAECACNSVS